MTKLKGRRPSASMVVALLALFAALGGTVYAAGRINGHKIKFNSMPGNRIKRGTINTNQLNLGSIGTAFVSTSKVKNSGLVRASQGQTVTVLTSGPFKISLQCANGGGGKTADTLVATSSEANSSLDNGATLGTTSNLVGGQNSATYAASTGTARSLIAPSGAYLNGVSNEGVNAFGAACFASFSGFSS